MPTIGDLADFGFQIELDSRNYGRVTMWIAGRKLNPLDNDIYLPTFHSRLERDIQRLESKPFVCDGFDELSRQATYEHLEQVTNCELKVLDFDSTVRAAICYYVENLAVGTILWSYWDSVHEPADEIGKVFSHGIQKHNLLSILRDSLKVIQRREQLPFQ